MPVGDIKQVRLVAQFGNQVSFNIRHYRVKAIVGTELGDAFMATGFDLGIAGQYKACIAAASTWRGVGVKTVWPTPGIEFSQVASAGVGSLAGDVLPPQTCGLIGFRTLVPGRTGHGRIYMPFPTESVNDASGLPTVAYQTLMGTLGNNLSGDFVGTSGGNTTTWTPIIYHRVGHSGTDLIAGGYYTRSRWATQRRRGGFGAANQLPF